MSTPNLHEERVSTLQNVTGSQYNSLISLYFALDQSKIRADILYLLKNIAKPRGKIFRPIILPMKNF